MYPYVLFAVTLLRLMHAVEVQGNEGPPTCGQVCDFDGNFKNADCFEIDLHEVPSSNGCQSARWLDLSDNRITSIHENDLLGYRDVEHLDLSGNLVSNLEPRSFAGCSSVVYISLSSNRIRVLQNEVFSECNDTLHELHFDRNELAVIESGAFDYLSGLTHLFLSHNILENLQSLIFQDLHSLGSLYLNSNRLTSLPEGLFANLSRLQNLDLSNNDLLVLSDELFSPCCRLVTFVLANNRLRNIPNRSSSSCLDELQTLDIRNNNITDASNITQYIHTTEKLFIDDNPFYCDCNLENVRKWVQQEVTSKTSCELTCIEPSSGESILIRSLPDLCPTPTAPPVTTLQSTTIGGDNRRTTLSTLAKTVSAKAVKGIENSAKDDDEDEKPRPVAAEMLGDAEGSLSYYGLIVGIMVVAIFLFIILVSIIILLAICLCHTNRNVEKMTKAILESKITPRPLKKVVNRVTERTASKAGSHQTKTIDDTINPEKHSNEIYDETPLKHQRIPHESTPKDTRIDMSGVRKRSPQPTDKMLPDNSPNKGDSIKRDENATIIEEKKPVNRKLGNQFEEMTEDHLKTDGHENLNEIPKNPKGKGLEKMTTAILESKILPGPLKKVVNRAKNLKSPKAGSNKTKAIDDTTNRGKHSHEINDETPLKHKRNPHESTPKDTKINMSGVCERSPQPTDKMLPDNSPNKGDSIKRDENATIKEEKKPVNLKTDSYETLNEFPRNSKGKGLEVNAAENYDYDKENSLNNSFQTKKVENDNENYGKGLKLKYITQNNGEGKSEVFKESDRDNLNLTSSNC